MLQVFFSYAHEDEGLRNLLEKHLASLKRQGMIQLWHDRRILAGSDLDQTISSGLESAHMILLLVSPDFLDSDYCYNQEMRRALEKHRERSAVVIPVILRPCDWESTELRDLRATPTDGKAVTMYANLDQAFAIIAKDIREVATQLGEVAETERRHESSPKADKRETESVRSSNLRVKRRFSDHERDKFIEDSYEYIVRYFEGSLEELSFRNPNIETRFQRFDKSSFSARIYDMDERVAECHVRLDRGALDYPGINYSASATLAHSGFNEQLTVVDDGYVLMLRPLMNRATGMPSREGLSQEGAAELYWSMLIRPLQ